METFLTILLVYMLVLTIGLRVWCLTMGNPNRYGEEN